MSATNSHSTKLTAFAKKAGLIFTKCDKDWGGTIAYTFKGSNSTVCGFRSKEAAIKHWIGGEFSGRTGALVLDLIRRSK